MEARASAARLVDLSVSARDQIFEVGAQFRLTLEGDDAGEIGGGALIRGR